MRREGNGDFDFFWSNGCRVGFEDGAGKRKRKEDRETEGGQVAMKREG